MTVCQILDCSRRSEKRGMCPMHYLRWWKHGDPLFIPLRSCRRPVIDRLRANTIRRDPKPGQAIGCLEIIKKARTGPYAMLQVEGNPKLAHRVAFEEAYGPIPEGKSVCHTCDNPPCIEPTHLFAGTALENTRDMISKGRQIVLRGDAAPWSKLTADDVRSIRSSAETNVALAAKFNVSPTCISKARTRATWATL